MRCAVNFIDRLKMLMQSHGDSVESLAHKSGIPYVMLIGLINRGWERTDALTVWRVCEYYNVSMDYMITGMSK